MGHESVSRIIPNTLTARHVTGTRNARGCTNVGNLICPAEFDTGAGAKVMILSVPEGHDKPLKYPLMFEVSDLVIVSKMDVAPYFDFDLDELKRNVRMRNPRATILPLSAKTGEGMDAWCDWLRDEVRNWKR